MKLSVSFYTHRFHISQEKAENLRIGFLKSDKDRELGQALIDRLEVGKYTAVMLTEWESSAVSDDHRMYVREIILEPVGDVT